MDISSAFTYLNRAQKRALVIRDELKQLDARNLDKHINGVTEDEPPTYKKINNKIVPPLAQVTLKESASNYDLGNVNFPEEKDAVYRVHLTVENGEYQMRTSELIPYDENELFSVPIHCFVAKNILPLFQARWEAIHTRKNKINEARHVAYGMVNQPKAHFSEGKTLARLDPAKAGRNGTSQARKRAKGDPIPKHPSNKRQKTGLSTIPDIVKSEMFNAIPNQIKVDLFNTIVKTAFPNFDNLITASWNVVSIYLNVGSEFPELHKAIVDLNTVLREFENAYGARRMKKEPQETTIQQASSASGTRPEKPTPEEARDGGRATIPNARVRHGPHLQPEDETTVSSANAEDDASDEQQEMVPPRILQMTGYENNEELSHRRAQFEQTRYDRMMDIRRSNARYTPELQAPRSIPNSAKSTPEQQQQQQQDGPTSLLSRIKKFQEQYASSSTTNGRSGGGGGGGTKASRDRAPEQPQGNMDNLYEEEDEDEDEVETAIRQEVRRQDPIKQLPSPREPTTREPTQREGEVFLGPSKLGRPKQSANATSTAPMAPMVHNRKDANGSDSRRRY